MLRKLLFILVFISVFLFAGRAFAGYVPTLVSPTNGSSSRAVDNLSFVWTAPSDAVDSYQIQVSFDAAFSDLVFSYSVASTETNRVISGLPGVMTLYWRVAGVRGSLFYYSPSYSFSTTTAPGSADIVLFTEDFSGGLGSWTYYSYSTTSFLTITSGMLNANFWSYNAPYYGYIYRPVTLPSTVCYLNYKWTHYYYPSSYPYDRLLVSYSTDGGGSWNTMKDHIGPGTNGFDSGYTSTTGTPSSASPWVTEKLAFPTSLQGQTVLVRFYFESDFGPDAWLDDVSVSYQGYPITVTSSVGNPSPQGETSFGPGQEIDASVQDYVYSAGTAGVRYKCLGWEGTGSVPETGHTNSVTFKIFRDSTIDWIWQKEYMLEVTSDGDKGVITYYGVSWWASGTEITVTNTTPILGTSSDGVRWYSNGWAGTGAVPASGTTQEYTVSVNQPSSINFQWIYQYRVTIINEKGIGNPTPEVGEHWLVSGARLAFNVAAIVNVGSGAAYTSMGWRGTGSIDDGTTNSGTATISMASTITWKWSAQYYLTVISEFGKTSGSESGWYAEDTVLSVSCGQYFNEGSDTRYECRGWSGSGSVFDGLGLSTGGFRIIAVTTIEFLWYKQYTVEIAANYGSTNPSGTMWVDENSSIGAAALPIANTSNTKYSWAGWLGTGLTALPSGGINSSFTITQPSTFTAMWDVEFLISVTCSSGTLAQDYNGWYAKGTEVSITAYPPTASAGYSYVSAWNGSGEGSINIPAAADNLNTQSISVYSPLSQNVGWVTRVSLTISVPQGIGSPVPGVGVHWFFIGDLVEGFAKFDVNGIRCTGYNATGSLISSTDPWFSFNIYAPSTIEFIYQVPAASDEFTWNGSSEIGSNINGDTVVISRKSNGSPVIVFHDEVSGNLESIFYISGVCYSRTIDYIGTGDTEVSMVLDSDNVPHVIYYDCAAGYLMYAFYDTNNWRTSTLDTNSGSGRYNSLAIDRNGNLYAAYYNNVSGQLHMARTTISSKAANKAAAWTTETVDDSGNVGMYCSIAVSPLWAEPHISYYDSTNQTLKYAYRDHESSAWDLATIQYNGDLGTNTSIVVDSSGTPTIACQENTVETNTQGLVVLILREEGWQIQSLDDDGVTGFYPSLRMDVDGNLHIAYHNFSDLFYAFYNGESWSINQLTEGSSVANHVSLALDDEGNPAIVYWDNKDLKYVDSTSGEFEQTIENHFEYEDTTAGDQVDDQVDDTTGDGGGGGCFIATAAFSSYSASTVVGLTSFRDSTVNLSASGQSLVNLYYCCSPVVAKELDPAVKAVIRKLVD